MKQTRPPTKNPDPLFAGTCHKCGAGYEAARSELRVIEDQREGPLAEATCMNPECKSRFWLYPKK